MEWKPSRGFDGIKEEFLVNMKTWDELFNIHLKDKEIYFGEIAGKHSEISGTLDAGDIVVCSHEDTKQLFFNTHGSYKPCKHSFLKTFLDSLLDEKSDSAPRFKQLLSEIIG